MPTRTKYTYHIDPRLPPRTKYTFKTLPDRPIRTKYTLWPISALRLQWAVSILKPASGSHGRLFPSNSSLFFERCCGTSTTKYYIRNKSPLSFQNAKKISTQTSMPQAQRRLRGTMTSVSCVSLRQGSMKPEHWQSSLVKVMLPRGILTTTSIESGMANPKESK